MGFFDLFRPKWKHSDPSIRQAAIETLTDPVAIEYVAVEDPEINLRILALQRPHCPEHVAPWVAKNDEDSKVREAALSCMGSAAPRPPTATNEAPAGEKPAVSDLDDEQSLRKLYCEIMDLGQSPYNKAISALEGHFEQMLRALKDGADPISGKPTTRQEVGKGLCRMVTKVRSTHLSEMRSTLTPEKEARLDSLLEGVHDLGTSLQKR